MSQLRPVKGPQLKSSGGNGDRPKTKTENLLRGLGS